MNDQTNTDQPRGEVREITQADLRNHAELAEALITGENVHKLGKAVNRSPEEDLYQRVAASVDAAPTSQKRGFGLFRPGESIPTHVVYAYLENAPVAQDGTVHPDHYPCNMRTMLTSEPTLIEQPTVAACYTISNISRVAPEERGKFNGKTLLGSVYNKLHEEGVKEVVTLSPMQNFETWLKGKADAGDNSFLDKQAQDWLMNQSSVNGSAIHRLASLFENEQYSALNGDDLQRFNAIISDVAVIYLKLAQQDTVTPGKASAFDIVENFHLGNGAQIAKFTPQRLKDDDEIIVTSIKRDKNGDIALDEDGNEIDVSLNRGNVSYRYVPEKDRAANQDSIKFGTVRPGEETLAPAPINPAHPSIDARFDAVLARIAEEHPQASVHALGSEHRGSLGLGGGLQAVPSTPAGQIS